MNQEKSMICRKLASVAGVACCHKNVDIEFLNKNYTLHEIALVLPYIQRAVIL